MVMLTAINGNGWYQTGGYGDSTGYWWSTGEVVPYDGLQLDQPGSSTCLILKMSYLSVQDDTCQSNHFICEAG